MSALSRLLCRLQQQQQRALTAAAANPVCQHLPSSVAVLQSASNSRRQKSTSNAESIHSRKMSSVASIKENFTLPKKYHGLENNVW